MCKRVKSTRDIQMANGSSGLLTGDTGFTLVEVLVAMLLMIVGIFAWMQLQVSAIKINEASKRLMLAQNKVSQELDQIKTIGYSNIAKDSNILTNTSFGYLGTYTNLPASYQLSGIDSSCNAPATYCVYKNLSGSKIINKVPVKYYYTLKLAVDPGFLSYQQIAKIDATVYWRTGSTLKNMQISSFVGM